MSSEHILVTGAAGFVGSNAVRHFAEEGGNRHITALVSPNTSNEAVENLSRYVGKDNVVRLDLTDARGVDEQNLQADLVLHFAGLDGSGQYKRDHSDEIYTVNMQINKNLLRAVSLYKPKMLLVSSTDVHPNTLETITEDTPSVDAPNGYQRSKLELEQLPNEFNLDKVVVVRPGNLYGPGEALHDPNRSRFVSSAVRNALTGHPIIVWGDGNSTRSFLYVDDFLKIVTRLVHEGPSAGPTIVASNNNISLGEVAEQIKSLTGDEVNIVYDTRGTNDRRIFSTAKLHSIIGDFEETSLEDGLQKTIADIRQRTSQHV